MMNSKLLRDFYKSSPMGEGILNWYPFNKKSSALESSGGVLKGVFCTHCVEVKEFGDEYNGENKFDYVIMIDPSEITVESLKRYHGYLNAHGRLLMAFENPYGLQYFAGKRNPHTGIPFTFRQGESKKEVEKRLKQAGFHGQKWYYPFTNHYFCRELYSENCLPNEFLNNRGYVFLEEDFTKEYDERELWKEVIRNGAFPFLCHSYLVEARVCVGDDPCDVDFAAITAYREPDRAFITTLHSNGIVRKRAAFDQGKPSLRAIADYHKDLANLGVNVLPVTLDKDCLVMKRLNLPTLWDYLSEQLVCSELEDTELFLLFDKLRESVHKAAQNGRCYWELVPANCFYDQENDDLIFFDQEYYWENIDPDMALVRAIYALKYSEAFQKDDRTEGWIEQLKERYNLTQKWEGLAQIADIGTWDFVFGNEQTRFLDQAVRRAKVRIEERTAERAWMSARKGSHDDAMSTVVTKLRSMGINHPAIYGYGKRGKMLRYVLETNDIGVACIIDKQRPIVRGVPLYAAVTDISEEVIFAEGIKPDIIIVTPVKEADEIAAGLRRKTNCPVRTIKELADEQN